MVETPLVRTCRGPAGVALWGPSSQGSAEPRVTIWEGWLKNVNVYTLLHLNLQVNPRRQAKVGQGINSLGGRVQDVEQALVYAHFVLLTSVLIDERGTVDRELCFLSGERYGTHHFSPGAENGVQDSAYGLVDYLMVVGANTNSKARA